MDDNPYQSPNAVEDSLPAQSRPTVPLWRRLVSLPLIALGGIFAFTSILLILGITAQIVSGRQITRSAVIVEAVVDPIVAVLMLWGGLRLRRLKS